MTTATMKMEGKKQPLEMSDFEQTRTIISN